MLQAEEDRDQVRRYLAQQAMEKELLGAETKPYNSDRSVIIAARLVIALYGVLIVYRFVRPTFAVTPSHVTK